jgi:hypothetical protein
MASDELSVALPFFACSMVLLLFIVELLLSRAGMEWLVVD